MRPAPAPTSAALYSSAEACHLTGASYRMVDCWARRQVVVPRQPARGSGTARRYTAEDVRLLTVAARLSALGMPLDGVAEVIAQLRQLGSPSWPERATVFPDGTVLPGLTSRYGAAYVLDLAACRASVPSAELLTA